MCAYNFSIKVFLETSTLPKIINPPVLKNHPACPHFITIMTYTITGLAKLFNIFLNVKWF